MNFFVVQASVSRSTVNVSVYVSQLCSDFCVLHMYIYIYQIEIREAIVVVLYFNVISSWHHGSVTAADVSVMGCRLRPSGLSR